MLYRCVPGVTIGHTKAPLGGCKARAAVGRATIDVYRALVYCARLSHAMRLIIASQEHDNADI